MTGIKDFIEVGANDADSLFECAQRYAAKIGDAPENIMRKLLGEIITLRKIQRINFEDMEETGLASFTIRHAIKDRKRMPLAQCDA